MTTDFDPRTATAARMLAEVRQMLAAQIADADAALDVVDQWTASRSEFEQQAVDRSDEIRELRAAGEKAARWIGRIDALGSKPDERDAATLLVAYLRESAA